MLRVRPGTCSRAEPRRDPARVGADRLRRLRRAAGAHRAAARAVRRAARLARRRTSSRTRSRPATCCPGPASTQLAIFCAWRLRGRAGRAGRRRCFIVPGLVADPRAGGALPRGRRRSGCAAPAPARAPRSPRWPCRPARPASRPSWRRAHGAQPCALGRRTSPPARSRGRDARAVAGARAARAAALVELGRRAAPRRRRARSRARAAAVRRGRRRRGGLLRAGLGGAQGRRALLRRRLRDHPADAGRRRRPLPLDDQRRSSSTRSRSGRSRPGRSSRPSPWSATRRPASAAALLAALVAFAPSFAFVAARRPTRFDRLRDDPNAAAFLDGAGPAAIGAILGSAIPLAARARRDLAVRRARRGRGLAARAAARRRAHAPAGRDGRRRHRARRRPAPVLTVNWRRNHCRDRISRELVRAARELTSRGPAASRRSRRGP